MLVSLRTRPGRMGERLAFPPAWLFLFAGCQAAAVAARVSAGSVVIGYGRSMDPLYPEGTVLVLQQLRWDNLQPGMTAIYSKGTAD